MRIGDLAGLAGVTPRTVRHYHHLGLLPEPARTAAGYRSYGLSHASRLIQICRLTALGLSLSEVADALAGDRADGAAVDGVPHRADLREMLTDLDAELADQEKQIARRRAVIRDMVDGGLDPTLTPGLAHAARVAGPLSRSEAELLRVAEALEDEPPGEQATAYQREAPTPERTRLRDLDVLFAGLADVAEDDPRVEEVARQIFDALPELLPGPQERAPSAAQLTLGQLVLADLNPAQHRVVALLLQYGAG